jgi:hypothetical protein
VPVPPSDPDPDREADPEWQPAAIVAPVEPDVLVGLLGDEDRLKVVAAIVLGASGLRDISRASGVDLRRVVRAVNRLVNNGLVIEGPGDAHAIADFAFSAAAQAVAVERPERDEHGDAPPDEARVLRAFVRDGRLTSIPSAWGKRRVVLEWLAQRFEPGLRYSEPMVNESLRQVHPDTAALRRYLVDDGFLSRDHGEYWRSGGRVEPEPREESS